MNLGRKLSAGAVTLGLSFGALTLGAACGSTNPQTKPQTSGDDKAGETGSSGETKPSGGDKADPGDGGGEHTCGAGSCGR